jgi:hypothetical protein
MGVTESIRTREPEALWSVSNGQWLRPARDVPGAVKWHVLTVVGGAILFVTFFLPLDSLTSRTTHDKPVYFFCELLRHTDRIPATFSSPRALGKLAFRFTLAVLPHVWGMLLTLMSLLSLVGLRRLRTVPQALGVLVGIVTVSAWVIFTAGPITAFLKNPSWDPASLMFLTLFGVTSVVGVAGVLHALLALRRPGWAYLYHAFAGAAAMVFVLLAFHAVTVIEGGLRGLYLGLTGLTGTTLAWCLLLFARIGEARAVTGLSWRRTSWYLLTLRLPKAPGSAGLCPRCRYNLYGLRERRCPECGRGFTFEEILSTPQSLGFAGAIQEPDNCSAP